MDAGKLAVCSHVVAVDERTTEQRRREEAEKWAQLIAGGVAQAHRTSHPSPAPVPASTTGVWRGSDGAMTPEAAFASTLNGSAAEEGDGISRIALRLNAGDLGEVALVVERSTGGVRVIIGVDDPHAERAVLPEMRALERALEASGIALASVRIVQGARAGTVLAPSSGKQRPDDPKSSDSPDGPNQATKRRNTRRLNLIG